MGSERRGVAHQHVLEWDVRRLGAPLVGKAGSSGTGEAWPRVVRSARGWGTTILSRLVISGSRSHTILGRWSYVVDRPPWRGDRDPGSGEGGREREGYTTETPNPLSHAPVAPSPHHPLIMHLTWTGQQRCGSALASSLTGSLALTQRSDSTRRAVLFRARHRVGVRVGFSWPRCVVINLPYCKT